MYVYVSDFFLRARKLKQLLQHSISRVNVASVCSSFKSDLLWSYIH